MTTTREWILARHPEGMVSPDDFTLREVPLAEPGDGQILVKTRVLSLDPAMRSWITGRTTYTDGVQIGDVMRSIGVGEVVASRHADWAEGDRLVGMVGWREHAVLDGGGRGAPRPVPDGIPATWMLGVLGLTGLTAWIGLEEIGKPQPGQTVLVSGAAGATGSVAAQLARVGGCRVVGIAGGADKCAWLTGEARLDGAIDYKSENVRRRIRELCPDGVDVYFDNVGGPTLDAALANLAMGARVVLCGAISQYNSTSFEGPRNYMALLTRRARMEGFVVFDHAKRFGEGIAHLAGLVRAGEIVHREDIQHGFERAPHTLVRLFEGKNQGKQLLEL